MKIAMKAPPDRLYGARTLHVNEHEASILKQIGWTVIEDKKQRADPGPHWEPPRFLTASITLGPKPKRKYTKRKKPNGEADKPKRHYRRRDMVAEE